MTTNCMEKRVNRFVQKWVLLFQKKRITEVPKSFHFSFLQLWDFSRDLEKVLK